MGRCAHRPCWLRHPERRRLAPLSSRAQAAGPFVILSAGGEAAGVEGSRRRQRLAAAEGLPRSGCAQPRPGASTGPEKASDLRKGGGQGPKGGRAHRPCYLRRPERRAAGPFVILSVASLQASGVEGFVILSEGREAPAVEGSRRRQRLAAAEGLPQSGCARPRPGASTRPGNAPGLWKPRQSRVDGQVCPSTQLAMVRPPAGSPYETSTNRRTGGSGPRRTCRWRTSCSHSLTGGDWCRFRAAGLELDGHPTSGRPRERSR